MGQELLDDPALATEFAPCCRDRTSCYAQVGAVKDHCDIDFYLVGAHVHVNGTNQILRVLCG